MQYKNQKKVKIKNIVFNNNSRLNLIAGPCVIENEDILFNIAEQLNRIQNSGRIDVIFKNSFDKANRSSIDSFRGPGLKKGIEILEKVKNKFDLPLLLDVHKVEEVEPVSEIADIIQIPAFLCRQTDLIVAAGKTGKTVNVKKGQFLAPWDIKNIVNKIESTGNRNILLTERGVCFGYNRWVVDICSFPAMAETGYPVIFDITHSVQTPGGEGSHSGGNTDYIPYLARAGVAAGISGIFLEVHPEPEKGLSDAKNMLKLDKLDNLLDELLEIDRIIKKYDI